MAENLSRFIIIDGVQIEKTRARRLGYIDENDKIVSRKAKATPDVADDAQPETEPDEVDVDDAPQVEAPSVDEPTSRRARDAKSARRG